MFKSRKLGVVLAAFLLYVFTGFGTQSASAAASPTDIAGNWASAQISSLISQGVVSGYADGTFKPNNSISRAEFITMINRAFNFNATSVISFSDVKTSDWFYQDICKARAAGYIAGYTDGTMKPNNSVSREEAAVILAQALGMGSSSGSLSFSDAAKIQTWSQAAISSMVGVGYISGYPDGTFKPANSISRAEAAAMLFAGKSRVLVTGISLNKSSVVIGIGKSETMAATVSPSNATNQKLNWSSSNTSVATVNSTGVVYGLKEGTATITVTTAERSKTDTCIVTVKDIVEVTGVSLDKSSLTLNIGETYTLKATVSPSDATDKELTWTSSDEDVATVSSSGKVTAQGEGDCTIKAKAKDGSGEYDTCEVIVNASGQIDDVSLNESNITIEEGGTFRLIPSIDPESAPNQGLEWESDDPDIASVSDNGVVYGESEGTTTIWVRSSEDSNIEDSCDVEVTKHSGNDVSVDSVSLSESSIDLAVDDTYQLYATIDPYDAYDQAVWWESSDDSVAKVDSDTGLVTAIGDGDCTITVTTNDGGATDECDITVNGDSGNGDLTLSRTAMTLYLSGTDSKGISATIDGDDSDILDVTWESNNEDVATVDSNDLDATIYAEGRGTCIITVWVETQNDKYEATCNVTVKS